MRNRFRIWGQLVAPLAAIGLLWFGCEREQQPPKGPAGKVPGKLVLYALDGEALDRESGMPENKKANEERYYKYPVLGKVEITDADEKQKIIQALGIARKEKADIAKCFWPHHGVQYEQDGLTLDLVICFMCNQLYEYGPNKPRNEPISKSAQATLDKYLKRAGISRGEAGKK